MNLLTQPFSQTIHAKDKTGKDITLRYVYVPQQQTLLPYHMGRLTRRLDNTETLVGNVQAPRHLKQSEAYNAFITWIIHDMDTCGYAFHSFV